MRLTHLLAIGSFAALCAGCSDQPDPNDPSQYNPNNPYGQPGQPGYPQPGYPPQPGYAPQPGYPPQPGGYPAPAPQPGGYPAPAPAPAPVLVPAPAAGGQAQPINPMAAAAAQPIMMGLARTKLPGMRAEGQAIAANFGQGQTFEQNFQLQPGKCYGAIGVGMGIQELDVKIVLHAAPAPPVVVSQDNDQGSQAVIGEGGKCFRNPSPIPVAAPAKLVVHARSGQGMAMAQLYVK